MPRSPRVPVRALAAAPLVGLAWLAGAAVTPQAVVVGVGPRGDTTVRSDHPRARAGASTRLVVRARHPRERAYLRFVVPVPAGRHVSGAALILHARTASHGVVVALRRVRGTGWRPARLDWRNAPRLGGAVARASGFRRGARVAFDAGALVPAAGGSVGVALTVASRRGAAAFASSEAARGGPRLVVRLDAAPPTVRVTVPPGPTPTPTPTPVAPGPPPGGYASRGMYDRELDGGFSHIAAAGFNLIDSTPANVDELPVGLTGLTWVGDYDNSTCSWQVSDATLRSEVQAHAGDPRVGVWFISDEPDPYACPSAPAQHAARSQLIHSVDPRARTVIVVDANSAQATLGQIPSWKGTADYVGLDPYVCWQGEPCHYEWIDKIAQAATTAGLDYWAVVQAFGDPEGGGDTMCTTTNGCGKARLPTPTELHQEFLHWRASAMTGYLVFAWRWPSGDSSLWLANHPELQAQLRLENGA